MILQSSYQTRTDDVPVIACSMGTSRRFVLRRPTYEEFIDELKEVFELDRAPTLYVSNFSVCEGEPFEVGRNVYEVMAPFLDKLNVVEGAQSVEDTFRQSTSYVAVSSKQQRNPTSTPSRGGLKKITSAAEEASSFMTSVHDSISEEEHAAGHTTSESEGDRWQHIEESGNSDEDRTVYVRSAAADQNLAPLAAPATPQPSQEEEEDRFRIVIRGPEPDQKAEFQTRGRHLVRKVMIGACKTFDVDYHSSRLVLIGPKGARTICTKTDTLATYGIDASSKLMLEVVDESEEEEE